MRFFSEFLVRMAPQLILIVLGAIIIILDFISDYIITRLRVKKTQLLWNEHSKSLSARERMEQVVEWSKCNKQKNGYRFLYVPYPWEEPISIFDAMIDGNYYKGTVDEISKATKIPASICEEIFCSCYLVDYSSESINKIINKIKAC